MQLNQERILTYLVVQMRLAQYEVLWYYGMFASSKEEEEVVQKIIPKKKVMSKTTESRVQYV